MKDYKDVKIVHDEYPFNRFPDWVTPVAVERRHNSENLNYFEHPENAVYVFGPEDGSIIQVFLKHCHRFVVIPSKHCLNLAAAVNVILYHRQMKQEIK
jgi:tRNA(Leu) C34 or U34 (ribose-2'-O)-methylase TrmL